MNTGLLPVFCCQCHESIDAVQRPAAALPCDCLIALCVQCARRQLHDCEGYSYESLFYFCPICTVKATSVNGGFLKLDEEKIRQSVDTLVCAAQFRLEGKWPRKAYREKVNLRGLLKKFAVMSALIEVVSKLLKVSFSEEELQTIIARLEWLIQNPPDSNPPYTRLPWGPLDHVEITLNRWLPLMLVDPESIESTCMACCDTMESDKTVLYGCSCISYICCKCALVRCQDDSNTFHEGLKCVMCNNKSRHLLHNIEEAEELEATLFKAATARLRTWGFTQLLSDRHKQFAAKFIQAFQLYFLNEVLPEGCHLPSESQYHAMSFQTLKLQLCRMEKAAQQKELDDDSDDLPPAFSGQVELPLGPLKPLHPRCNPFLSFYLRHAPEIGINIGIEQMFIMPVQTQTSLMRTKDDFKRREEERQKRINAESEMQQQQVVQPVFGEKYLAIQPTPCPECNVDPRNLFLLHRHLFHYHDRIEYAQQDDMEETEECIAERDLIMNLGVNERFYAATEADRKDGDGVGEKEAAEIDQGTLDGNESSDSESIEIIETTTRIVSSSNSRPPAQLQGAAYDSAEEGEILDELPTASSSLPATTALSRPRPEHVPKKPAKPTIVAIALDEGKAAAERIQNLRRTQLNGVYELRIESTPADEIENQSHGFNDFRLRYEIHLNPEDMIRFAQTEGNNTRSSVASSEDINEVFQGEVQVHTELCPIVQIRLGLKVQAGFAGMVNKYYFDNQTVHSKKTLGVLGVPRLSRLIIRPVKPQAWQERPYRDRHLPPWLQKRQGHVTKAQHAERFAADQKKKRLEEEKLNPKPVLPEPKVILDSYEQALMESDSDSDDGRGKNKKKRKQPQAPPQYRPPPPLNQPRLSAANLAAMPPQPRWQPPAPPRPPPPPPPPLPYHLSQRLGPSVQEEQVSWQEDRYRSSDYDYDQHANKRRRYDNEDGYRD